jgi:hypothetical protein
MSSSNIQSVQVTDTAQAVNGRSRLAGVYFVSTATAATLTFKTGGSGGTANFTITSPAAAGAFDFLIPDMGILFADGIHVTFSGAGVTSVTLLFEGGAAA